MKKTTFSHGFTLVELIVAVGLFAIVMMIASGAYLIMISANRTAQGITTGINNLSYALESMTRNIRTGTDYDCQFGSGFPILPGPPGFKFFDQHVNPVWYRISDIGRRIQESRDDGAFWVDLTDESVDITSFAFDCSGTEIRGDAAQARVIITVSGSVSAGPGNPPKSFTVETMATMRGTDL